MQLDASQELACASPPVDMDAVPEEPHHNNIANLKRRRPALACTRCRKRKIRCDHKTPCNNCTKSNIISCQYLESQSPVGRVPRAKPPPQRETPRPIAPRSTPLASSLQSPNVSSIESHVSRAGSLEESVSALARPGHEAGVRHNDNTDGHGVSAVESVKEKPVRHSFVNQSSWVNNTSLVRAALIAWFHAVTTASPTLMDSLI